MAQKKNSGDDLKFEIIQGEKMTEEDLDVKVRILPKMIYNQIMKEQKSELKRYYKSRFRKETTRIDLNINMESINSAENLQLLQSDHHRDCSSEQTPLGAQGF